MIDSKLATQLSAMARFRNLLVHRYGDIDPDRVWDIVSTNLGDLDEFFHRLARTMMPEGASPSSGDDAATP